MPSRQGRTVVVTQGKEPVLVAISDVAGTLLNTFELNVTPLHEDLIVDTNGAGDAFTGGFLAVVAANLDHKGVLNSAFNIEEAVQAGNKMAALIIQRSGCQFPIDDKTMS